MSIFSKLAKVVKGVAASPIGKVALGAVPGVGPALAAGASLYGAYQASKARSAAEMGAVAAGQAAGILPRGGIGGPGVMPMVAMSAVSPVIGAAGRAVTMAGNVIRSATGKIIGFFVGGRRISRKQGVALAKRVGLDAAAAALGISAVEMAQAIMEETGKPRRGRGISAAQLRNAKRVNRRIINMTKDLQEIGTVTVRKRACR